MATNLINCSVDGDGTFFTTLQDAGDGPLVMTGPFSSTSTLQKQMWTDLTGFLEVELPVGHYKTIISPDAGYGVTANNFTIGGLQPTTASYYFYQDPHYQNQGETVNSFVWINGTTNFQGDQITLDSNVDRILIRNTTGPQNYDQAGQVDPTSPNNRIEITVVLYDTFIMPSESLTINIDIDGAAVPLDLDNEWTIDDETGLVVPDYQTNSPFEVRFIPIRVGPLNNCSMYLKRMDVNNTDSDFSNDSYTFYNYSESPYDDQQLNILDNKMCSSGAHGSSASSNQQNKGFTDTDYFSTTGYGEGVTSLLGVPFSNDLINGYAVRPFITTFYNAETDIGINTYADEAGSGAYENCVAHARNNIEDYGSQGLYGNSIGASFLNGANLRWQFTVGGRVMPGGFISGNPNSTGGEWPRVTMPNDNDQYFFNLNAWGFNTWDYDGDNNTSEILFNVLNTTIRWPMVSTSGNYFYYENFVSGSNSPFGTPVPTLNNDAGGGHSGGVQSLGTNFNGYSFSVGSYSILDLKMPFNSDFIFEPPSQATGYWTLDSPVYVYIFYTANPIFYTSSATTNPYGPDEDD